MNKQIEKKVREIIDKWLGCFDDNGIYQPCKIPKKDREIMVKQICQLFELKPELESDPEFIGEQLLKEATKPDKGRLLNLKEQMDIFLKALKTIDDDRFDQARLLATNKVVEAQDAKTASIVDKQARQEMVEEIEKKMYPSQYTGEFRVVQTQEMKAGAWQELKRKWGVK